MGCITALQPVGNCIAAVPLLGSLFICGPGIAGGGGSSNGGLSSGGSRRTGGSAGGSAGGSIGPANASAVGALSGEGMDWSASPQDSGLDAAGIAMAAGVLAAARLRPRSADISNLNAAAFLPLSADRFLVAAHPTGVLLLRR